MGIEYLKGDATSPHAVGNKIIAHICNDLGRWGKGFVMAISARWSEPEEQYRLWNKGRGSSEFSLGAIQLVQVEPCIWVANMIGQHGIKTGSKGVPIRYESVDACLAKVAAEALPLQASVHMPRIGCGLAGGTWDRIEPLIAKQLCDCGIHVYVYDWQ